MQEEKLNRLYDAVIENHILTETILRKYDITPEDIDGLVYKGILAETSDLVYTFLDYENLCNYAWILAANKEYDKARVCLKKASDINPKYIKASYRLFYESVFSKDYKYIFSSFLRMHSTHDKDYIIDNNIYLYLLSFTLNLPDVFKEYVNLLWFPDITFTDNSCEEYEINDLYNDIFKGRFKYSFKKLNDIVAKRNHTTMRFTLLKTLLIRTLENQNIYTQKLMDIVKSQNYEEALEMLSNKFNLTKNEKSYVKLLQNICLLKEINIHQKSTGSQTTSVYKAIKEKNYFLAFQISSSNDQKSGDESILTLLLKEICYLNAQNYEKQDKQLTQIYTSLVNKEPNALDLIKNYLNDINKSEYFFLINDLILLCNLTKEKSYFKPLSILNQIKNNEFSFDKDSFLNLFEISLQSKKIQQAKLYLDILLQGNEVFGCNIDFSLLKQKMENLTNSINDEYDLSIDDLIKYKYIELLERQGIVILKPLDSVTTEVIIRKINDEYNDVSVISIGLKETRQLVLIYKPKLREVNNPKDILDYSDELYNSGKYEEAKNSYIKLIQFGKPKFFVYAKIGICCLKMNAKKEALEYLLVANNMLKKDNPNDCTYDELIQSLMIETENINTFKLDNVLSLELKK